MDIGESIKSHWPYVVGGLVGVYIIYKYTGASSTTTATSSGVDPNMLAYAAQQNQLQAQSSLANQQMQLQANAQQAAINLQNAQLQAQSNNATQRNEIAYNTALGSTASSIGNSIASVIQAQSALPAAAINAAMAENQTALQTSAATAIAGINANSSNIQSYGGIIQSQLNQQTQANKDFYTSLSNSGNQVVASNMAAMAATSSAYSAFAQSNPLVVNAVGSNSASNVASVSSAASTSAAANASGTASTMGALGTIGASLLAF